MHDLENIIAGTRCLEVAMLGSVRIPVRAVSELERADVEHAARAAVDLSLPGVMREELFEDRRWCFLLGRAALDPRAIADGLRVPLWRPSELTALAATDVDVLLAAQTKAQARATPDFDEKIADALKAHAAQHGFDRLRARGIGAAEFFAVGAREVTFYQLLYFADLAGT